jgi:hypothetical protein
VKMRGKVVVRIKPEPESLDADALYLAQPQPISTDIKPDRPLCQ